MPTILIVYYSRNGHTRKLAMEIRGVLGGEIEEIRETRCRARALRTLRIMVNSVVTRAGAILPAAKDPAQYDFLILGGPIVAGRIAAPVRSYAQRYGHRARGVAFFCAEAGHGANMAFHELARLCGRSPLATIVVKTDQLTPPSAHSDSLIDFSCRIKPALAVRMAAG